MPCPYGCTSAAIWRCTPIRARHVSRGGRDRHDVPLWVYLASNLSMRFHGEHHFHAFPYLVRSGGMIQAFGPAMGHKAIHPETGDVSLRCEGFNEKNDYDRQTTCDQDYLRKMARDT